MSKDTEFPFERARRVTPEENLRFRQALKDQLGFKLRKRQPLDEKQNESEKISHSEDFLETSGTWQDERAAEETIQEIYDARK
ncbi:MAG: AT hook motif protein [Microcystaceae cyanobacterium]